MGGIVDFFANTIVYVCGLGKTKGVFSYLSRVFKDDRPIRLVLRIGTYLCESWLFNLDTCRLFGFIIGIS